MVSTDIHSSNGECFMNMTMINVCKLVVIPNVNKDDVTDGAGKLGIILSPAGGGVGWGGGGN
jgi:hypothetical protein